MIRVWVTGAGGFIGGRLVARLKVEGWPVIGTTRRDLDLCDRDAIQAFIRHQSPQYLVHLAACTDRNESHEVQERQYQDTFLAGRNLLEVAAREGVAVLAAGSVDELGDQTGILTTDLLARPFSGYGHCKALLRQTAEFLVRRYPVLINWFRPFTVYGPGQIGEMLIPHACQAACRGITADFSDGEQRRDFLFVDDLVEWIIEQLLSKNQEAGFRIYHIGTGEGILVRDILEAIREEFPSASFRIGVKPRRLGQSDLQIAPKQCHWEAKVAWREGIRRTAAWWRHMS